jgi:hypothetical protein
MGVFTWGGRATDSFGCRYSATNLFLASVRVLLFSTGAAPVSAGRARTTVLSDRERLSAVCFPSSKSGSVKPPYRESLNFISGSNSSSGSWTWESPLAGPQNMTSTRQIVTIDSILFIIGSGQIRQSIIYIYSFF